MMNVSHVCGLEKVSGGSCWGILLLASVKLKQANALLITLWLCRYEGKWGALYLVKTAFKCNFTHSSLLCLTVFPDYWLSQNKQNSSTRPEYWFSWRSTGMLWVFEKKMVCSRYCRYNNSFKLKSHTHKVVIYHKTCVLDVAIESSRSCLTPLLRCTRNIWRNSVFPP